MSFYNDLGNKRKILFLYSTTPPRASTPEDSVQAAVNKLAERTNALKLDGVVVYDVQDERSGVAQLDR